MANCKTKWNIINKLYTSIENSRPELGTAKTSKKYKTWIKKVNRRNKLLKSARTKCN